MGVCKQYIAGGVWAEAFDSLLVEVEIAGCEIFQMNVKGSIG